MNIESIKAILIESSIYHSEENILGNISVIGYEKKFKWSWIATQLNTFIVVTHFGDKEIDESLMEKHLYESFKFSKQNYKGWPRGFQSGLGVISILISNNISDKAKDYCKKLKSGKKWAGFSIPVVYDSKTKEIFQFEKNPSWGRIYYPHFTQLINNLK
ncbi:hypothetical protein QYS49_27415 [Marivirga salinae]|uniref:Uncharacterized protein n=1 Tax=Marivirga salinarum TaxID=3059078 RepID=A0AA49GE68_9BACT|nr:hypothetical protein [Marivirga sp. BDSF4-3]WKK75257.2 hypothetical protein QYS49_27415 [Marivirga sp. BDSF4-3]